MRTLAEFEVAAGDRVPFVLTWVPSYAPRAAAVRRLRRARRRRRSSGATGSRAAPTRAGTRSAVRRSLLDAQGADVRAERRHRGGGHDLAAGADRRPAELGLPLLLAARRRVHAAGAGRRRVHGRGEGVARLVAAGRGRRPRGPADHVLARPGGAGCPRRSSTGCRGYEGSRPVRVGNEAAGQFQLDVYGEVLDGLHSAREAGLANEDDAWTPAAWCSPTTSRASGSEPDSSLWEVRGPRQHFVHSKVMAWVGVRPDDPHGGALGSRRRRWTGGGPRATPSTRRCARRGYDADARHLHPVLRVQGPGRRAAAHPARRVPARRTTTACAARSRPCERELCEDGFVLRYRTDADPHGESGPSTGCPATRARSSRAASGSPTPSP